MPRWLPAELPTLPDFPAHLQPATFVTMQPIDACKPEEWHTGIEHFLTDDAWLLMPKIDGQRCPTWALPEEVIYRSREPNLRASSDPRRDKALMLAARKFGPMLIDGEDVFYSADGGQYRTASEALSRNAIIGSTEPARPVYAMFRLLYFRGQNLSDRGIIEGHALLEPMLMDVQADYPGVLSRVPLYHTTDSKRLCVQETIGQEREGFVFYHQAAGYIGGKSTPKRSMIFRIKPPTYFEAIVTGLTKPTRADLPFGAIIISRVMPDASQKPVGKIGSGFTLDDREKIAYAFKQAGQVYVNAHTQGWTVEGQVHHGVFDSVVS